MIQENSFYFISQLEIFRIFFFSLCDCRSCEWKNDSFLTFSPFFSRWYSVRMAKYGNLKKCFYFIWSSSSSLCSYHFDCHFTALWKRNLYNFFSILLTIFFLVTKFMRIRWNTIPHLTRSCSFLISNISIWS